MVCGVLCGVVYGWCVVYGVLQDYQMAVDINGEDSHSYNNMGVCKVCSHSYNNMGVCKVCRIGPVCHRSRYSPACVTKLGGG